jgi:sodium-dependent phosphate cotransporter
MLLQSSSVFTSSLVPLVATGVISLESVFPLTLGSNIGTTLTGIIAALGQSTNFVPSFQLAMCHLFFNISGILIWYPIVYMRRVPIRIARYLGERSAERKWFGVAYLVVVFVIMPLILLGLAAISDILLYVVFGLFVLFLLCLQTLVVMQSTPMLSKYLPVKMQTWDFLPKPVRNALCGKPKKSKKSVRSNKVKPILDETVQVKVYPQEMDIQRNEKEKQIQLEETSF